MRTLIFVLVLFVTTAFSCCNGPSSCGKKYRANGTMPTLHYALETMKLQDHAAIKQAIKTYRTQVASLPCGMNTDSFKHGTFDRELFLKQSKKVQKAQAQADLFETIYKELSKEQKEQMHRLMAAHQHYVAGLKSSCDSKKACHSKKSCDSKQSCDRRDCAKTSCAHCGCTAHKHCGCLDGKPCKCNSGKSCGCDSKKKTCHSKKCS